MSESIVHIKDASGIWRKVCSNNVYIRKSGVWRNIKGEKIYADGQWRDIVCEFAPPEVRLVWDSETPSFSDLGGNSPEGTIYANLELDRPLIAGEVVTIQLDYELYTSWMIWEQHTWSKIGVSIGVDSGGVISAPNHFGTVVQDGADKSGVVPDIVFTPGTEVARVGLWVRCDGDEDTSGKLRAAIAGVTAYGANVNVLYPTANNPDIEVSVVEGSS